MLRLSWIFLVVVLGLPAAAIALGGGAWPFELAHHFTIHLAVLAALASVVLALIGLRARAAVAGALALAFAANGVALPAGALGGGARAATPSAATLNLVSFNILADQHSPDELMAWLAGGPADVLVLLEATPAWHSRLARLKPVYPHSVLAVPREDPSPYHDGEFAVRSGIAILSRRPLSDVRVFYPAGPFKPAVTARLATDGGDITIAAAHPKSPMTASGLAERDRYFRGLADALAVVEGPLVVAGDFNATPYTPRFRGLVTRLRLDPPPLAPATFPALAGPFGLAIDHVLVRGVRLERLDALPPMGSDHRGLLARLVLSAAKAPGRRNAPRHAGLSSAPARKL